MTAWLTQIIPDYRNDQARTANQVNRADSTSLLSSLRWRYSASRVVFAQRLAVVTNDFRNTGAVGQEGAIGTARALIWSGDAAIAINNATTLNAGLRSEEQDDTPQTCDDRHDARGLTDHVRLR